MGCNPCARRNEPPFWLFKEADTPGCVHQYTDNVLLTGGTVGVSTADLNQIDVRGLPMVRGSISWRAGSQNSPTNASGAAPSTASKTSKPLSATTLMSTMKLPRPSCGPELQTKSWTASLITPAAPSPPTLPDLSHEPRGQETSVRTPTPATLSRSDPAPFGDSSPQVLWLADYVSVSTRYPVPATLGRFGSAAVDTVHRDTDPCPCAASWARCGTSRHCLYRSLAAFRNAPPTATTIAGSPRSSHWPQSALPADLCRHRSSRSDSASRLCPPTSRTRWCRTAAVPHTG